MQELAEQIAKTQLEIVAIQQTRRRGNGLIKGNNYSVLCSGSNKIDQTGTGFIPMKKALKCTLGFEPHNERICKLRIRGKYNDITLIRVYATTDDKIDENKEQRYEYLQSVVDEVPGDLNAKLGKERVYKNV